MSLNYMDSKLLRTVKNRIFEELTDTIQQHSVYRDKVPVYHKFPYSERPSFGVVMKNASATRRPLSPDDYAGTMASHVSIARAKDKEGRLLKWVWEDELGVTTLQRNEDISSQLSGTSEHGTNRVFHVQNTPIVAGQYNTKVADNFRQIEMTYDGERIMAEFVDGESGKIVLPQAPANGGTLLVSYYYKSIVPQGRYYLELLDDTHFVIDPIYIEEEEVVIQKTTGTETSASVDHGNLLAGFDRLYTKKYERSHKIYLVRDTDYTIDTDGNIAFLEPLPVAHTLLADYRWIGSTMGPFDMPEHDHQYNNTALKGVILAFGSERIVGDKNVIIVWPQRETSAKIYSGHWTMNFDLEVMCKDTLQLPELTDLIVDDMWSRKRVRLTMEGLTMESMEPAGEIEEVYDENTGDMYYKNSISMVLMTEWKRYIPYLTEIYDYETTIHRYGPQTSEYHITQDGRLLETQVVPYTKPFEVKYPEFGQVRYY